MQLKLKFNEPSPEWSGIFFREALCYRDTSLSDASKYLLGENFGDYPIHSNHVWYSAVHRVIEGVMERMIIPFARMDSDFSPTMLMNFGSGYYSNKSPISFPFPPFANVIELYSYRNMKWGNDFYANRTIRHMMACRYLAFQHLIRAFIDTDPSPLSNILYTQNVPGKTGYSRYQAQLTEPCVFDEKGFCKTGQSLQSVKTLIAQLKEEDLKVESDDEIIFQFQEHKDDAIKIRRENEKYGVEEGASEFIEFDVYPRLTLSGNLNLISFVEIRPSHTGATYEYVQHEVFYSRKHSFKENYEYAKDDLHKKFYGVEEPTININPILNLISISPTCYNEHTFKRGDSDVYELKFKLFDLFDSYHILREGMSVVLQKDVSYIKQRLYIESYDFDPFDNELIVKVFAHEDLSPDSDYTRETDTVVEGRTKLLVTFKTQEKINSTNSQYYSFSYNVWRNPEALHAYPGWSREIDFANNYHATVRNAFCGKENTIFSFLMDTFKEFYSNDFGKNNKLYFSLPSTPPPRLYAKNGALVPQGDTRKYVSVADKLKKSNFNFGENWCVSGLLRAVDTKSPYLPISNRQSLDLLWAYQAFIGHFSTSYCFVSSQSSYQGDIRLKYRIVTEKARVRMRYYQNGSYALFEPLSNGNCGAQIENGKDGFAKLETCSTYTKTIELSEILDYENSIREIENTRISSEQGEARYVGPVSGPGWVELNATYVRDNLTTDIAQSFNKYYAYEGPSTEPSKVIRSYDSVIQVPFDYDFFNNRCIYDAEIEFTLKRPATKSDVPSGDLWMLVGNLNADIDGIFPPREIAGSGFIKSVQLIVPEEMEDANKGLTKKGDYEKAYDEAFKPGIHLVRFGHTGKITDFSGMSIQDYIREYIETLKHELGNDIGSCDEIPTYTEELPTGETVLIEETSSGRHFEKFLKPSIKLEHPTITPYLTFDAFHVLYEINPRTEKYVPIQGWYTQNGSVLSMGCSQTSIDNNEPMCSSVAVYPEGEDDMYVTQNRQTFQSVSDTLKIKSVFKKLMFRIDWNFKCLPCEPAD